MSITEVRRNLAGVIDDVIDSQVPVAIPRQGGRSVVIIPMEEWKSCQESAAINKVFRVGFQGLMPVVVPAPEVEGK
jgi:prevent-host-death family protein